MTALASPSSSAPRRIRLYFAGPDVFDPDWSAQKTALRRLCEHQITTVPRTEIIPLIPVDGAGRTSLEIYEGNMALLRQADGVVANLSPFRGPEPDSGTVFETAWAIGHGIPVVGYSHDDRSYVDRLSSLQAVFRESPEDPPRDAKNRIVEDFGAPLNLMLTHGLSLPLQKTRDGALNQILVCIQQMRTRPGGSR